MIILDTNVVSEPSKPQRDPRVMSWLNRQHRESLFVTAISLAEMYSGIAVLPEGRRKEGLRLTTEEYLKWFVNPLLHFDREAARAYAEIVVRAKAKKYTVSTADGFIAAIAKAHGFSVATRDVDPFRAAGVAVINPWEA
jgi:predicted nucleic acid-binding protein